jgi:hypothetical protein
MDLTADIFAARPVQKFFLQGRLPLTPVIPPAACVPLKKACLNPK